MGRIAMVLAMTCMSACGAASVKARRPLVTDRTPLGSKEVLVGRWFAANGWCIDKRDEDRVWARLCDPDGPRVLALLTFRDGVLAQAEVLVPVGAPRQGAAMPYPSAASPGSRRLLARSSDDANELVDALAFELETRYGTPVDDSNPEPRLTWVTGQERIILYLERNRSWIVERHTRATDPEPAVNPRLTEAW